MLIVSSKVLSGLSQDTARKGLEEVLQECGGTLVEYAVVPDNRQAIRECLLNLIEKKRPAVLLTVGGTGVRPTDWAPEATRDVIDKEIPGIGEAMRAESLKKVRTGMLSRGIAGIKNSTLIVNLPGSAKGARENLEVLLPILSHTVEKIS